MPEWLKGADCKSVAERLRWFESNSPHHLVLDQSGLRVRAWKPDCWLLACPRGAGVAHLFGKEEVMGPNPIVGSKLCLIFLPRGRKLG